MNKFIQDHFEEIEELEIINEEVCEEEENNRIRMLIDKGEPLPEGYRESKENSFVYIRMPNYDLSTEELRTLIMINQAKNIKTIRRCVKFFTVFAIILMVISILSAFLQLLE